MHTRKSETLKGENIRGFQCPETVLELKVSILLYITYHHSTINNASLGKKAVLHFPKIFYDYDGYNKVKRKNSNPVHSMTSIFFTGKPVNNSFYRKQG